MPFDLPTLAALSQRAREAFRATLPGTDANAWPNTNAVHAKVLALVLRPVYERLGWLYRQMFASTADSEHLERRHGFEIGLPRAAASRAVGEVQTTGFPGTTYPAGIRILSGTTAYVTTAAATADVGGVVTMAVRAEATGASGNRAAGETMAVADPGTWQDLGPVVTVGPDGLGGGADREDVEAYRARVLDRRRAEPNGGSYDDYARWAREVPGVVRAWAAPASGDSGVVYVTFLFAGRPDLIPEEADVEVVHTALEARRMVGRGLMVAAPIPVDVDIEIEDLAPDTMAVRAAIVAALGSLFVSARVRPGLPADPFVLSRSWIVEAAARAAGEGAHVLVSPASDLMFTAGHKPVLGTVTFG